MGYYLFTNYVCSCVDVLLDYGASTTTCLLPMETCIVSLTTFASSKDIFTLSGNQRGVTTCTLDADNEIGSKKFTLDVKGNQVNMGF